MAEVKLPAHRTVEQEIGFIETAIRFTERYSGEEWAEQQLDRLTVERQKLVELKAKLDAEKPAAPKAKKTKKGKK